MRKILIFIALFLRSAIMEAQIFDAFNPGFKGNVKSVHYIAYFGSGGDPFAERFDGNIVKEYNFEFDKNKKLINFVETQQVGECPFELSFDGEKLVAFYQKFGDKTVLQKGTVMWKEHSYIVTKDDIRKMKFVEAYELDSKNQIQKITIKELNSNGIVSKINTYEIIRDQLGVSKVFYLENYVAENSVKKCEIVYSERIFDTKGNLQSFNTKNSCSATFEKHEMRFEYWK